MKTSFFFLPSKLSPKHRLILFLSLVVVFLLIFWVKFLISKTPTVISTSPAADQNLVLDNQALVINFTSPLSSKQAQLISLDSSPSLNLDLRWATDQQLIATPDQPLVSATTYQITVLSRNHPLHTFSFTTNLYSTSQLKDQAAEQIQADFDFTKTMSQFNQQYPWYQKLPIRNSQFTIVYDFNQLLFRIHLNSLTTPSEKTLLLNAAKAELENIGVNISEHQYKLIDPR